MAIDSKLEQSIKEAVEAAGQGPSLAQKIIAWSDAVISGNEDIQDVQSANRRLELLYDATQIEDLDDEESADSMEDEL